MTSDRELFERVRRLLHAEARLFGSSAHDAVTLRLDGVLASVNPRAPDRSMFNWVIADSRAALLKSYDEVARAYVNAGVRAWTVWVDEGDVETERELTLRGHLLDAKPRAMAAEIAALSLPPVGDLAWTETQDIATVAAINDAAYTFPPPAFAAALTRNVEPRWHAYLAHHDGRPVASVMAYESVDGDCGLSAVATLPEARGSGTASRLLAVALQQAAGRGAVTTTLQATSKGAPVYTRLGYRDLGAMCMWEHRTPKPAPSGATNGT
jgi:GNAT superfamily N-acetyltransferase